LSTTDKVRRKRITKTDDNIDGQKVKRRKSDMNIKQPESSIPNLLSSTTTEKKSSSDSNKVKLKRKFSFFFYYFLFLKNVSNYREIGFSPVSSAQSDSCSNSNHTSESSNISTANSKQTQVDK
jgi:hypothetical protein